MIKKGRPLIDNRKHQELRQEKSVKNRRQRTEKVFYEVQGKDCAAFDTISSNLSSIN